jgi:hypothetical protein
MAKIKVKVEKQRGCGYRKPGGMYFVSDGIAAPCCKLPFPLTVCPCCNTGIKQSRGFTWVNSSLFSSQKCTIKDTHDHFENRYNGICPMNLDNQRVGLMWVGEKYYPTADHFTREAQSMGVSKRIAQVPKDFEVGKTWIYLAHPKAVSAVNEKGSIDFAPGVFRAFKPQAIEYIVTGKETQEQLQSLTDRGFTLVKVIRDIDTQMIIS